MGSFFLTNSKDNEVKEKALNLFKNKGMDDYKVISIWDMNCFILK